MTYEEAVGRFVRELKEKSHWLLIVDEPAKFVVAGVYQALTLVLPPEKVFLLDVTFAIQTEGTTCRLAALTVAKQDVPRNVFLAVIGMYVILPESAEEQDLLVVADNPENAFNFVATIDSGKFWESTHAVN